MDTTGCHRWESADIVSILECDTQRNRACIYVALNVTAQPTTVLIQFVKEIDSGKRYWNATTGRFTEFGPQIGLEIQSSKQNRCCLTYRSYILPRRYRPKEGISGIRLDRRTTGVLWAPILAILEIVTSSLEWSIGSFKEAGAKNTGGQIWRQAHGP